MDGCFCAVLFISITLSIFITYSNFEHDFFFWQTLTSEDFRKNGLDLVCFGDGLPLAILLRKDPTLGSFNLNLGKPFEINFNKNFKLCFFI